MMMQHVPSLLLILVEQIIQFHSGWIMCSVQDPKRFWMTAVFQDGEFTAVIIGSMMLELCVQIVSVLFSMDTCSVIYHCSGS